MNKLYLCCSLTKNIHLPCFITIYANLGSCFYCYLYVLQRVSGKIFITIKKKKRKDLGVSK